jgi:FtsZ-binding cell division protein ZapB
MEYTALLPVVINGIKELKNIVNNNNQNISTELQAAKAEIETLKTEKADILARLAAIETRLTNGGL